MMRHGASPYHTSEEINRENGVYAVDAVGNDINESGEEGEDDEEIDSTVVQAVSNWGATSGGLAFGLNLYDAVEAGIQAFRHKNDHEKPIIDLYAKIKKEGNAYSKMKTNLTPWMKMARNQLKAIHA